MKQESTMVTAKNAEQGHACALQFKEKSRKVQSNMINDIMTHNNTIAMDSVSNAMAALSKQSNTLDMLSTGPRNNKVLMD